jgi:hypothetical protein
VFADDRGVIVTSVGTFFFLYNFSQFSKVHTDASLCSTVTLCLVIFLYLVAYTLHEILPMHSSVSASKNQLS